MYGTQTVLEVRQFTLTTFGVLTVIIFKLIFDVLMLFSTSKGSIRNGGRHLSPPSGSPLVIWQRAANYFHFSSSIIHWLFGEQTWCPQGCTFLYWGSRAMWATHLSSMRNSSTNSPWCHLDIQDVCFPPPSLDQITAACLGPVLRSPYVFLSAISGKSNYTQRELLIPGYGLADWEPLRRAHAVDPGYSSQASHQHIISFSSSSASWSPQVGITARPGEFLR